MEMNPNSRANALGGFSDRVLIVEDTLPPAILARLRREAELWPHIWLRVDTAGNGDEAFPFSWDGFAYAYTGPNLAGLTRLFRAFRRHQIRSDGGGRYTALSNTIAHV